MRVETNLPLGARASRRSIQQAIVPRSTGAEFNRAGRLSSAFGPSAVGAFALALLLGFAITLSPGRGAHAAEVPEEAMAPLLAGGAAPAAAGSLATPHTRLAYHYGWRHATRKPRRYRSRRRVRRGPQRRARATKPAGPSWLQTASNPDPVQLIISLGQQRIYVYKGAKLVASSRVSTGKPGYRTPTGIFHVLQKNRWHRSNIYNNAPMHYMQRLTWDGIALHAGYVPNYPASHGCIRLPRPFAIKLFKYTRMGERIIVVRDRAEPQLIDHPTLFQPMPLTDVLAAFDRKRTNAPRDEGSQVGRPPIGPEAEDVRSGKETDREARIRALPLRGMLVETSAMMGEGSRAPRTGEGDATRSADASAPEADTPGAARDAAAQAALSVADSEARLAIIEAYRSRSRAPLRMLITRPTQRDRIRDVQRLLAEMGYDPGPADGYVGRMTRGAIKRFEEALGLQSRGVLSEAFVKRLYRVLGREEKRSSRLIVRQNHKTLFTAPVTVADPERKLGTHIFTAMAFDENARKARWVAVTASSGRRDARKGGPRRSKRRGREEAVAAIVRYVPTAREALDRITIPAEARQRIAQLLTPGSSLIVTDDGPSEEPDKYTDFIVRTY